MIKINIENKLNEKRSKELKYSINEMINTVINKFYKKICSEKIDNSSYHFEMEFDNNNSFYIDLIYTNKELIVDYGYIDYKGEHKNVISLQEALNINKYSKDIEYNLDKFLQNNEHRFYGCFTTQNIDTKIPIFNENDAKNRKNNEQRYNCVELYHVKTLDYER